MKRMRCLCRCRLTSLIASTWRWHFRVSWRIARRPAADFDLWSKLLLGSGLGAENEGVAEVVEAEDKLAEVAIALAQNPLVRIALGKRALEVGRNIFHMPPSNKPSSVFIRVNPWSSRPGSHRAGIVQTVPRRAAHIVYPGPKATGTRGPLGLSHSPDPLLRTATRFQIDHRRAAPAPS